MALKFYRKESNVFDSDTTMVTRPGTSRSKLVLLFLVLLLGAGLIFAGIRFLSLNKGTGTPNNSVASLTPTPFATAAPEAPTPTIEMTVTPTGKAGKTTPTPTTSTKVTPTPTGAAKTAPMSIEILNGSGQAGVAGTAASGMKKLGYSISGTGNADTFNFVGYTIKIKKSKSTQLAQLKKDVATLGTVTDSLITLPESSDADAQLIVGK
jgi:hypothetical protein